MGDYGASSEAVICGKSPFALRELLASSVLNVKVGVAAVPTLPMVPSSVSATPKHESGALADSITGLNICTIGASERFIISSDSSRHSSTHASEAEGDYIIRSAVVPPMITETVVTFHDVNIPSVSKMGVKVTSPVRASLFQDSDSTKTMKADTAGPSYSAKQDLSMGSRELNFKTLHQVFAPQWNIRKMDYHHLFTEFNMGTACQTCLNAKVRMRTEYCLSERKRLESEYEKQANLLKVRDAEIKTLKAQLLLKETEAAKAVHLRAQVAELLSSVSTKDLKLKELNTIVSSLRFQKDGLVGQMHELGATCSGLCGQVSGYKRLKEQIEEFQDAQMNIVNDKVEKLDADLLEIALHLEENFYPHLLNTISGWRWLLTHGLKLAVVKLLNSLEYLSALGAAISRAIEKGRLREVDFPLLSELKSHKDASTADVMDLLRLEGPLADAPGMSDLQPDIEQLKLPIHCLEDQVIFGETYLLVALDVTHSRVERIRENVAAQRSALIEDYEIMGTDGLEDAQGSGQGEASSFPNTSLNLYAPFPNASMTSYGPSHLVLKVGMPMSTGITSYVSYVSENGVSPLLDLIIVRGPTHHNHSPRKDLLYSISFVMTYLLALRRTTLAFLFSSGRISSVRPAPELSMHDDPSANSIHGSESSSLFFMGVLEDRPPNALQ
nr:hypothetical protein [Tanacetum cinerariifolium]